MTDDANRDDRFNLIAPGKRWHPAMRNRRDNRALLGATRIKPTPAALDAQERLRAAAVYGPGWDRVELLSTTEATVGGTVVTLDRHTGRLSCAMHRGRDTCWHITRLLEVAQPRRRQP